MFIFFCALVGFWLGFLLLALLDAVDEPSAWLLVMFITLLGAFLGLTVSNSICTAPSASETITNRYQLQGMPFSESIFLEKIESESDTLYVYSVDNDQKTISENDVEVSIVYDGGGFVEVIKTIKTQSSICGDHVSLRYIFHLSEGAVYTVPK